MEKGKRAASAVLASAVAVMSIYCTVSRLGESLSDSESLCMTAAGLAMPVSAAQGGDIEQTEPTEESKSSRAEEKPISATKPSEAATEAKAVKEYGGEAYPVIESQYGSPGEITIKNTTDFDIDTDYELSAPLGFELEDTDEPQVLIVHTHACEAYLQQDEGVYYSEYTGRSTDNNENLTSAGQVLADTLTENGVAAVHSYTQHDNPSYNGSYDRSAQTIYEYLEEYPSIKVIIDFHRDSIGYGGEDGKIKPTFEVNGKKAAQIMIMSGYDPTGAYGFEHWEYNLRLALRIQQKAEQLYPGMTRPLYFGDFAYNMNINSGSLLIEVGTEVNTLDEAKYTAELLGEVIAQALAQ